MFLQKSKMHPNFAQTLCSLSDKCDPGSAYVSTSSTRKTPSPRWASITTSSQLSEQHRGTIRYLKLQTVKLAQNFLRSLRSRDGKEAPIPTIPFLRTRLSTKGLRRRGPPAQTAGRLPKRLAAPPERGRSLTHWFTCFLFRRDPRRAAEPSPSPQPSLPSSRHPAGRDARSRLLPS